MAAVPEVTLLAMDTTEAISEQCREVLSHILTTRKPAPGIAIWAPRAAPHARFTSRLKFFNQTFLDICDTTSFPDRTAMAVWPQSPCFLYLDTASAARASWERLVYTVDKIHTGELMRASQVFLHISRAGRKKVVWTEVFAFTVQSSLIEWLIVETPLPDDFPVLHDGLLDVTPSLLESASSPPEQASPAAQTQARPAVAVLANYQGSAGVLGDVSIEVTHLPKRPTTEAAAEPARKRSSAERANFRCAECGEHETSQRRRGPEGTLSLCNRCGLRWRKQQQMQAAQAAPKPAVSV